MKILERFKPNFSVVVPDLVNPVTNKPADPGMEAIAIANFPWEERGYRCLIWDTMTEMAKKVRAFNAKSSMKRVKIGEGPDAIHMPDKADYGAAQAVAWSLQSTLFQRKMHLIVLGHEALDQAQETGGFSLVGTATIAEYGSQFPQYIRLFPWQNMEQNTPVMNEVRAQLLAGHVYQAGMEIEVDDLPDHTVMVPKDNAGQVEFWNNIIDWCGLDRWPAEDEENPAYTRAAIYGRPKTGKTRLACSFPVGPIAYVAWDPGSELMTPVHRALKRGEVLNHAVDA